MRRRKFLIALGTGAVAAPLASFAQQAAKPFRVALLRFADLDSSKYYLESFKQGMRELGYVEGRNLVLELRFADGKAGRLPALAAELVKLNVDVIVATDTPATRAAQQATTAVPIIMANIIDPVGSGFVTSLARPGGNISGLSNMTSEVSPKHVELLAAMVPKLSRLAVLLNPANSGHPGILKSIQAAADKVAIKILPLEAETPQKIESAFAAMTQERAGAVIVAADAFFLQQHQQIAELAIRYRLPCISGFRQFAEAGIMMSYGQDVADFWRRSATYVDKILKGAKPGDLPIEQPTKFQLLINLKTAKALGLTVSKELRFRADELIE